jgi:hypothetical protein
MTVFYEIHFEGKIESINYVLDGLGKANFGQEGRRLIEEVYNWDEVADSTLEVYSQVLKKRKHDA